MAAIANLIHLGLSRLPTPSNTQAALDRAKESADADVLTDITVDFGASYYVLFSNNCVRLRLLQWLRLQSARCPEER